MIEVKTKDEKGKKWDVSRVSRAAATKGLEVLGSIPVTSLLEVHQHQQHQH